MTVSHLQVGLYILKLSVLNISLCGTKVVRIHQAFPESIIVFEYKKKTQKQETFSSLKVEYLENGMH